MNVLVFDQQKALKIASFSVEPIVTEVLCLEKRKSDEVAVYFVTTEEISRLHQEFFNDPSPTDCLSFPMDGELDETHHVLGEVFVCPQTAIDYVLSSAEEVSEDPYLETTLYLVHGLLHLLGYDDQTPTQEAEMRKAEKRHMSHLVGKKLLLTF